MQLKVKGMEVSVEKLAVSFQIYKYVYNNPYQYECN